MGLECLHNIHKIVHKDLKPANIVLDKDYNAKIIDFGLSEDISDTPSTRYGCTPYYSPPEFIQTVLMTENLCYTPKATYDIWSLGITISMMESSEKTTSFLKEIMDIDDKKQMEKQTPINIKKRIEEFLQHRNDETHIDHVIYKCLAYDPQERATAKEILVLLEKVTRF